MNWKTKSLFHEVNDRTKIHYHINFNPNDLSKKEIVIVFNYGLVCNFQHFDLQVDYFDKLGFKVLIHDYRCHFKSTSVDGIKSVTFENICHDLDSLLSYLNVNQSIMLAHSMGVNVTLEYARLYPKKLKAMALISGTVFPPQDVMFDSNIMDISEPYIIKAKENLGAIYDFIWKNAYKNPLAQIGVWQGGFNTKKTSIKWVEEYMQKIGELDPDIFFHLLDQMKEHTIINDLEKIKTPTLIIGGDKDKIIPNYLQRILKKYIKGSDLYIIKDGSHVPQVDFPEIMNERLNHFVEKFMN